MPPGQKRGRERGPDLFCQEMLHGRELRLTADKKDRLLQLTGPNKERLRKALPRERAAALLAAEGMLCARGASTWA